MNKGLERNWVRVRHWLHASQFHGGYLVDKLECVLSVLLAIAIAHVVGARNISWAAISGYMVMRGNVSDSLLRGTLRVLGTVFGAGLALLVVPAVQGSWPLSALVGALFGGVTLYGGLTSRRSYAWLFTGLTFEMILLDKLGHPSAVLAAFAGTRCLEVVSGTCACIVISTLSALTLRRRWPGTRAPLPLRIGWNLHALRHAVQGAVALGLLVLLGGVFEIGALAQGAISIMAVMIIPVGTLGLSGLAPVSRKLMQRIAGCLAGAALAAVLLVLAHGNAAVLIAGTAAGVLAGRHVEHRGQSVAYAGTQFTIAILVTLVPDSYAHAAIDPALGRLFGILVGMALLEPVLIAWHLIATAKFSRFSPLRGR